MQRAVLSKLTLAALTLAACAPAWALYKVVGPDGRITYTDRPPADQPSQTLKANGSSASTDSLPFELQRVTSRYPVTLYSGTNCGSCDTARQMLKGRGVPFVEKTVSTADDVKAFNKAEGTDQVPVIRIGQKQLQGFNQADLASYLDAAGYPAKSSLPPNYSWPAASPLAPTAEAKKPASEAEAASRPAPRGSDITPPPSGNAPAGIRF